MIKTIFYNKMRNIADKYNRKTKLKIVDQEVEDVNLVRCVKEYYDIEVKLDLGILRQSLTEIETNIVDMLLEENTKKEISEITGISERNIYYIIKRIKEKLSTNIKLSEMIEG
jgi:DNA-binding CsgD family transcriptional regulator